MEKWPQIGCGGRFRPFAKGPSQVVEFQDANGETVACTSERLPWKLDEMIKKEEYKGMITEASKNLRPQHIYEQMPTAHPLAAHISVKHACGEKDMLIMGISPDSINQWLRGDCPTMREHVWVYAIIQIAASEPGRIAMATILPGMLYSAMH